MNETKGKENIIEIIDNGPLKITGLITLHDQRRGISSTVSEVYLCRCGKSSNKPYCDSTHESTGQ